MKIKISLLSLYLTNLLAGTVITPLMPYMAQAIGTGGEEFSKIFLTLPSLVIVPFLLVSGTLAMFVNKRFLILLGLVLYVISGIGCLFFSSETLLLFFRALSGIAAGLVTPYAASLISEYFSSHARNKLLAQTGIINSIAGIILLTISGVLVTVFWKLGFLVFLVALVPFVLVKKNTHNVRRNKAKKKKYPFIAYFNFKFSIIKIFIAYLCISTLVFVYFSNVSFLIIEHNLGGAFQSAIAQSCYLLAGSISNVYMLAIKKYSIHLLFAIKIALVSIGFLTMSSFNLTLFHLYIGSFVLGLGYGGLNVVLVLLITELTSKASRINALAFLTAVLYFGQFISPVFFKEVNNIFNIKNNLIDFLLVGCIFAIATIALLRMFYKERKQYKSMLTSNSDNI